MEEWLGNICQYHTSISFGRSEPKKIRCTIWPHRRVRRTVKFASAFERGKMGGK